MTTTPNAISKIWYLSKFNLFKGMSSQEMQTLERMTIMRTLRKKEIIYLMGQPGRDVYLLKKGVVKISRVLEDGRELVLALLKPGEIFGELEAVNEEARNAQAVAHEDTMICVMNRNDLLGLVKMKPELGIRLSKIIGFRRRTIENKLENLIFRSIPQKLGLLLVELSEQFGEKQSNGIKINLSLTHYDLASLIGSSRATVTETLIDFKKSRFIEIQGKVITVADPEKLKSLPA